ncbi:unnamed protein product, partial [Durusdinium trenchii]
MNAQSPSKLAGSAGSALSGLFAAVGTVAILFAESWPLLIVGWGILAGFLIAIFVGKLRSQPPQGEVKFRIGPAIAQSVVSRSTWLVPLGIGVALLGVVSMVLPDSEMSAPDRYGWGLFLVGAGISSIGVARNDRKALAAGYVCWFLGGAAMVSLTLASPGEPVVIARSLTIGSLMALGGGAAAYVFFRGVTPVYDHGIAYGGQVCPWAQIDRWEIVDVDS